MRSCRPASTIRLDRPSMRDVIDFANNKLVICCPFTWKPYVPIYFLTKFQTKFNGMANRIFLHSKCNMPLKRYWRGRSRKVKCYDIYEKLIAAGGNVLCACNEINNNLKEQSWREKWLEYGDEEWAAGLWNVAVRRRPLRADFSPPKAGIDNSGASP